MIYYEIAVILSIPLTTILQGCGDLGPTYGFYVSDPSGIANVTVSFENGGTWPIGLVGSGSKTVMGLPGPMPNTADLNWVDSSAANHTQHVQITPLPLPTKTSYVGDCRMVYFIIQSDNTIKVMYHDPHFTQ